MLAAQKCEGLVKARAAAAEDGDMDWDPGNVPEKPREKVKQCVALFAFRLIVPELGFGDRRAPRAAAEYHGGHEVKRL